MSQIEAALREALANIARLDHTQPLLAARTIARAALSQQSPAPSPDLTDEEIHRLWLKHGPSARGGYIIKFARALLASPAPSVEPPDEVHSAQATKGEES